MAASSTPRPNPPLAPFEIQVSIPGSGRFKSLTSFVWKNIPGLAVITGRNGVGKSQFLEVLAHRLTQTSNPSNVEADRITVSTNDPDISPASVAFLPSTWTIPGSASMGLADLKSRKEQIWKEMQPHNYQHDMRIQTRRHRVLKAINRPDLSGISHEKFVDILPDDFVYMLDESEVSESLTFVFMGYRFQRLVEIEKNVPADQIEAKLGPAPWKVLNDVLAEAGFAYRVQSPEGVELLKSYQFKLKDVSGGLTIDPQDLSSGEKMILRVVLWLYSGQQHARFPRLLILDEPDAHLHPSMTRLFLDVLKNVLVDKYNVRVILCTHSPSTVALTSEESLFEMSKTGGTKIEPIAAAAAIGILTAGLVHVTRASKFVLVEDELDVEFYGALRDLLTDFGPSKDPMAIKPAPSIAFLPASTGKSSNKIGGGNTVVKGWVDKFDQPPLADIFTGVIDRDTGNVASNRIYVTGRYSVENYLLDPFIVFAILLSKNQSDAVAKIGLTPGEEHRLRMLPQATLQSVVDSVAAIITPKLSSPSNASKSVAFTNGLTLSYPEWMLNYRGHDLLPVFQANFGGHGLISPPILLQTMRRVRLIPIELAQILSAIQG